jgi:hypothetical protein
VTPSTTPGAPTIGAVTATLGSTSASVAFTPPADNGGSTITSYTASSTPSNITGSGSGSPVTVSGLTYGTSYTFKVYATNSVGKSSWSGASNSVTPSSTPSAPTLSTPTAGNAEVDLSWSAPASNGSAVASYKIYRGTSSGGESILLNTGNTNTTYANTGLTNGTTYYYKVSAVNANGEGGLSGEQSATPVAPATVPDAPTIGTATNPDGIHVNFSAPASDGGSPISYYTAVSSPGGITLAGSCCTITFGQYSGLNIGYGSLGTSYTFTVYATNGVGNGPSSGSSNAESLWYGEFYLSGGFYTDHVQLNGFPESSGNGAGITNANFYRQYSFFSPTYIGSGASSYSDYYMNYDTAYTYYMTAVTALGESPYSNALSVQAGSPTPSFSGPSSVPANNATTGTYSVTNASANSNAELYYQAPGTGYYSDGGSMCTTNSSGAQNTGSCSNTYGPWGSSSVGYWNFYVVVNGVQSNIVSTNFY